MGRAGEDLQTVSVSRWQPELSWMVSCLIHLLSCVSSPTFHQMLVS